VSFPLPTNSLARVLQRHDVPFVLVGAYAVIYHTQPRATADVDVVWLRSAESEHKLLGSLEEVHAGYLSKQIDPATGIERVVPVSLPYIQATHLMMLWTDFGFIDLFDFDPADAALPVNELFQRSVVDGEGFRYASLDDVLRMKRASGRSKDLADLEELERRITPPPSPPPDHP
jgi:hypothetical protein